MLQYSPEEDRESEKDEDPGHEPGREGGPGMFPSHLPDEQRETHTKNKKVNHSNGHF